jgi:hypothetical protein
VLRRTHVFLFGFLFVISAVISADGVTRDQASLTLRGTVHPRVVVSLETQHASVGRSGNVTPGFAPIARVATATNMRTGCDFTIECLDDAPVPMLLNGSPASFTDGRVRVSASGPGEPVVVSTANGSTATLILEVAAR